MPIISKQEQAIEALEDYLEYADLQNTSIALRNLTFRYVEGNEGHELWFEDFLPELDGLFEFFDTLQFIYPGNENRHPISRKVKSKLMSETTPGPTPETAPDAAPKTSPQTMSKTPLETILERKEKIMRFNARLRDEIYGFFSNTSVARMNRVLRDLVLAYLKADPREAYHFFKSNDYKELQMLFYLFETVEEEYKEEE